MIGTIMISQIVLLLSLVALGGAVIDPETLAKLNALQDQLTTLAKHTMIQQEFVEERIRTDGQSGIKQLRHDTEGSRNYYGSSHLDYSAAGIHDHSDYIRTLGMGEIAAVINGVEFRTRHLDFKLVRPSTTNTSFLAMEDIPYPEVPPEVTSKATVAEQILEMKEWFKAFATQNSTLRNYKNYFKPVMCYMEGMWTKDLTTEITEPFQSNRHRLDASSWDDLMQKVRYMAYTGIKDNFENIAFHPRKIMYMDSTTGVPVYGQWNYRVLCYPIPFDIPTKYLKQREDWAWSYPQDLDASGVLKTRGARFQLNDMETDEDYSDFNIYDKIMQVIPGLDNVPAADVKENYGAPLYTADGTKSPLRSSYYHRWYNFAKNGAMGTSLTHRGYSDQFLFVAVNSRDKIVPMTIDDCKSGVCTKYSTRVSYAIPMEIVYLTPLLKWNPYNIAYNQNPDITYDPNQDGTTITTAYNGANYETYYRTPVTFFNGPAVQADVADTIDPVVKMKTIDIYIPHCDPGVRSNPE
ncbi:uncharacterized protein LOC131941984 [Physella acuta]|uniref:uncharacterized protein LOC131941984 n=1 Tax=Physella acuta TaxID=109671 RepID=UPI0027DAF05F|nr:uncharacterized protein LOC131941984 [Physella acuta]